MQIIKKWWINKLKKSVPKRLCLHFWETCYPVFNYTTFEGMLFTFCCYFLLNGILIITGKFCINISLLAMDACEKTKRVIVKKCTITIYQYWLDLIFTTNFTTHKFNTHKKQCTFVSQLCWGPLIVTQSEQQYSSRFQKPNVFNCFIVFKCQEKSS